MVRDRESHKKKETARRRTRESLKKTARERGPGTSSTWAQCNEWWYEGKMVRHPSQDEQSEKQSKNMNGCGRDGGMKARRKTESGRRGGMGTRTEKEKTERGREGKEDARVGVGGSGARSAPEEIFTKEEKRKKEKKKELQAN